VPAPAKVPEAPPRRRGHPRKSVFRRQRQNIQRILHVKCSNKTKLYLLHFFYPEIIFSNQIKTAYQQFLFFLITVFRFIKSNETNLSPLHSDGFSLNEGHLQLDFTGFNWITLEADLAEQS
jgi:hypothetical protein